ncbi:MAG: hypothetical protein EBU11_10390 [Gammaproteobacteria bacterium]|nr:hypothetical protein [Gammaproteobacteria bacterium]
MRTGVTERDGETKQERSREIKRDGVIERNQERPEETDRDRVTQRSTRSLRHDRLRNNNHPETDKKRDNPVKTPGVFLNSADQAVNAANRQPQKYA